MSQVKIPTGEELRLVFEQIIDRAEPGEITAVGQAMESADMFRRLDQTMMVLSIAHGPYTAAKSIWAAILLIGMAMGRKQAEVEQLHKMMGVGDGSNR